MQRIAGFGLSFFTLPLALGLGWASCSTSVLAEEEYSWTPDENEIQHVSGDCSAQPRFDYWNRPYQPYGVTDPQTGQPYGGSGATGSDSGMGGGPGTTGDGQGLGGQDSSQFASALGGGAVGNPNSVAASATPFGYIDMAAPVTMFRERYDDALNINIPDRGEYIYAQCGCFRQAGAALTAGPPGANASINYQALSSYLEYAFSPRFSAFLYLPYQWVDFQELPPAQAGALAGTSPGSTSGFADMHAGFKYAFIANPDQYLTFQLRTYIPTGNSLKGLGTDHVSIETGLLYYQRLSENWIFQAEAKEWAPINVSSFASNVFQYGAGVGYIAARAGSIVVTPTFETVAWTFVGGQQFDAEQGVVSSASGTTVVNIKPGVRIGLSDVDAPSGQQRHSVYFGWGHPVTNDRLYKDIYRVEYRWIF